MFVCVWCVTFFSFACVCVCVSFQNVHMQLAKRFCFFLESQLCVFDFVCALAHTQARFSSSGGAGGCGCGGGWGGG